VADDRPQYQHGTGTIGGQTFHWGSGEPGHYWSIPYGDYPVTPDAPTGDWAHRAGAIPIANNVIADPQLGRNRIGIMIHSGSAPDLDTLYTQGCFKVAPSEWPAVRQEILSEAKNGPLYLHVAPGGVAAFTNTPTFSQAGSQTPASNANAVANTTAHTAVAATPPGTTINAANAPVAGALANQGPETVGSNPAYTFTLPKNAPMGMGNNNPLNIKYYKGAEKDHPGLIGPSENTDQGDPQMKFASPEAGWNAAYNLLNKKYSRGMTTPNQIIAGQGGWTPGNTQAAANVAKAAGIGPDDDIKFSDPDRAKAFMRALVTQEQGAAGAAYPDEMIAASIGGNAPAAGAPAAVAPIAPVSAGPAVASGAPATAAPTDDRPWYAKAFGTLMEGKDGKKSPFEQFSDAMVGSGPKEQQAAMEAQAPAKSALTAQGPGARNVSPGLQNVAQTYGQTLNSFSQPLTWNSAPPQAPTMPAAGLQPMLAPGVSLTSVQPLPQGIGYGINPVGYGFG
jgi:hypothetical protein